MTQVKLSDICSIQAGGTPSRSHPEYWRNGTIPWVKISDIKQKYLIETEEHISEQGLSNSSAKIFPKGTILYTIFATLGEACILGIDAATNQAIAGITINSEDVDRSYLYQYLLSKKTYVNSIGRGVAQNNINMGILRSFEVLLPSLSKQQRIAAQLEKLDDLILLRKQQLAKLDELVKARFVEMFGEKVAQEKGYTQMTLGEIYKFQYGKGNNIPESKGNYPVYGSNGQVGYHTEYNSEDAPVIGHIGAYAGIVNWG